jgi:hypothetical protein
MNPSPTPPLPELPFDGAPAEPARTAPPGSEPEANYWDFCPNCGSRLVNSGCKYRCTRCRYFMSCSDFD